MQLVIPLQSAMQYDNYRCAQVLLEEAGGVVSMKWWLGLPVGRGAVQGRQGYSE